MHACGHFDCIVLLSFPVEGGAGLLRSCQVLGALLPSLCPVNRGFCSPLLPLSLAASVGCGISATGLPITGPYRNAACPLPGNQSHREKSTRWRGLGPLLGPSRQLTSSPRLRFGSPVYRRSHCDGYRLQVLSPHAIHFSHLAGFPIGGPRP